MSSSFFLLLFLYFFIVTSVLGYGLFFQKIINYKDLNFNFGYSGILGLFILIFYSYLSNIFFSHSQIHNAILLLLGFLIFLYFFIKKKKFFFKETLLTFCIFSILFCALLIYKNHDDFPYYHFPYTYYLTQHELHIGMGNFGHGFRTPSSIFYLNSLFYLPYINYFLFNIGAILILGFSNLILIKNFFFNYNNFNQKLNINIISYLSLISFSFINIFFYRIGEHGTDRSAQILILILIIEIIYFMRLNLLKKNDLMYIYILLGLIISLKAFYFLYFILAIPIIFHIFTIKKKLFSVFIYLVFNNFSIFLIGISFFVLMTNFFNSGCLIYPLYFTCFENQAWSIPISEVKHMNDWYELWSKAGATPNSRVNNPSEYISHFNWTSNWINEYFFNKMSDFLLGLLTICIIFFISFLKYKKKITYYFNKNIIFVYLLLILLSIEWFYNHPALRYGGYTLIALILFIPLSFYLNNKIINNKEYISKVTLIFLITISIFLIRNIDRIIFEYNKYSYKPFEDHFYYLDSDHFRIEKRMKKIIQKNESCFNSINFEDCLGNTNKIQKKFGRIIFINEK